MDRLDLDLHLDDDPPPPRSAPRRAPRLRQPAVAPPAVALALVRLGTALRRHPVRARVLLALAQAVAGLLLVLVAGLADDRLHRGVESGAELPAVRQVTGHDLATNVDLTRFAPEQVPDVAAALQANGFRYVRQTFAWSDLEPDPGNFRWERADAIVDELERRGITTVAVLHRSPAWARATQAADAFDAPPSDPAAYEAFVRAFVTRYGDRVPFVQLWDLPNRTDHWGNQPASPVDYLGLLAIGFNAARAANPNVTVVLAELDPAPNGTADGAALVADGAADGAPSDLWFLRSLYAAGAAPFFDVVAARVDGGTRTPDDRGLRADAPSLSRAILFRDLLLEVGDAAKPIWATHYGWRVTTAGDTPPGINPSDQAAFVVAGLERARAEWPWLGPLFQWGLAPGPSLGDAVDPGNALLHADGAPTALLTALGVFATGGTPDVAPTGFLPVQARQFDYEGNWDLQHLGAETYRTTGEVGARLSVRFEGTGVIARVRLSRQAGALAVTLDGRPLPVDLASFQAADVDITLADGLVDGVHELTIELTEPGQFTIGGLVIERAIPLRWPIVLLLAGGAVLLFLGLRDLAVTLAERSGRLHRREGGDFWPELPLLPEWRPSRRA